MQSQSSNCSRRTDSDPSKGPTKVDRIYAAATSLFLSSTFQAVSVREIALASDIAPGSLHKLVGTKEDLLYQLLSKFEIGLIEEVNLHLAESSDCLSAMRRFTEVYVKYGATHRERLLLARREFHYLSLEQQKSLRDLRDKLVTRLWEIAAVGQAKKVFRIPEPRFSAKVILATLEGTIANRTLTSSQLIESIPLLQVMVTQFATAGRRS